MFKDVISMKIICIFIASDSKYKLRAVNKLIKRKITNEKGSIYQFTKVSLTLS